MNENQLNTNISLAPLALLYSIGVKARNKMFDWGILPSVEFDVPIISVGNISVGGTGKTPHTEYLIKLLRSKYRIAVLSRGYKRKTSGFYIANAESTPQQLGDEPYQIKIKFPEIIVAVDGNRRRGIKNILNLPEPPDLILLDDAYQHRYVVPGISTLLIDCNRLVYEDKLLPVGRLREHASGMSRANIVVITKCPDDIKPIDFRVISKRLNLYPYQHLFFSTFQYRNLKPVFPEFTNYIPELSKLDPSKDHILLVTGIASPLVLKEYLSKYTKQVTALKFPDHHNFSKKDIKNINTAFNNIDCENKFILVTEKDAVRLMHNKHIDENIKGKFFYLPLEVVFLQEQTELFNNKIIDYVRKNKKNS